MANLSEDIQCAGFDTRPSMLDRTDFASCNNVLDCTVGEKRMGYNADIRATNILLQGLPIDIYSLINHYTDAKDTWDNVKMLLKGSELTKEDRESQLFVIAVKLNKGLKGSNYDQLYAYLKQYEAHYHPQSSTTPPSTYLQPHFADNTQLDSGLSLTDNLIENLTNTLALLTQSYKTYLPQTNNQLKTSSNPRNQATVQDGRVVVQNVQGRQNRGQGNKARGAGAAGYGGAQNKVRNANPGQENGVALDEEQLLFLAGGQDNAADEDVDEPPVQDLALNMDNVFQAYECDAFDSDVDEAATTQTMFTVNLSSAYPVYDEAGPSYDSDVISEVHDNDHYQDAVCEHHEVHEMHDDVQPNYVVDSHADYTSDSNMISYDHSVQSEQVELYERWAKLKLPEREQKIDEQLRIVITDRNIKEENLKKELHSVKM
ncbi:hypothetical protein Tco_1060700 [Tanacetum coccineum]